MKRGNRASALAVWIASSSGLFACGATDIDLNCGPGSVAQDGKCVPPASERSAVPLGATGGAGASGAGGNAERSVCDGATHTLVPPRTPFVGTLVDFENMALAPFTTFSSTGAVDFRVEAPGANATAGAARAKGSGKPQGASFILTLGCTDVSALDGIVLWAKSDIRTTLVVGFSRPELVPQEHGGDCVGGCWGYPEVWLDLTPEWRLFAVPFAKAERPFWATPMPWKNVIMGLDLGMTGTNLDVQIDEVGFYAGNPPQAAMLPQ